MENINEENLGPIEETSNDYQKQIESFFNQMAYNINQKAMFYLGRALDNIAFAQLAKNHPKPILNKINYNGMDKDDIIRLRKDLAEKAKQYNEIIFKGKKYNILKSAEYNFISFTKYFNYNNWNMNPQEAVFFILSGYSFGMVIKK